MAKKPTTYTTPDKTEIEVIMRKKMQFGDYIKMMKQAKEKGWDVKSYQVGVFSIGFKKEV